MMKLHELSPPRGASTEEAGRARPRLRLGKTAGSGEKGQKSRTGYRSRPGFEGGQMPLVRRVPKRGFTNIFKPEYAVVNSRSSPSSRATSRRGAGASTASSAPAAGQGAGRRRGGKALTVSAHKFSKSARAKIEAAGGRCEELQACSKASATSSRPGPAQAGALHLRPARGLPDRLPHPDARASTRTRCSSS